MEEVKKILIIILLGVTVVGVIVIGTIIWFVVNIIKLIKT